ncbi:Presenilin-1 [Boothiomyces macroporosus]|uniref:Presenilin n=1 Tax=Boothiomyces macroporosus TaxID=261099 RepID=A0AAD5Y9G3_9FUNG|nr:Presenilin-1 [Boothiomyces macroporosus]
MQEQEHEETEEEKIQNIRFYVGQLYTILKPVTLTILTSILWVKLSNPSPPYFATNEIPRQVASVGTSFGTSGNSTSDNQQSLIIAGIIMGQIVVATVIMACLFRYGQVKIIYGILGVLILMLLGLFGYQLALMLLTISNIPFDWISFVFCLWNFVAVGLAAIFWKGPQVLQQGYLVLMSSMMAFSLSSLPALVTWILLGFLAVWDLIAVLCPYGPLRIMLESAQKNNTELPAALIYSAMVWVGMAAPPSPKQKHPLASPSQISPIELPQPLDVDEIVQDKPKVAVVDPSNEVNGSSADITSESPRDRGMDVADNLETKRLTSEIEMTELDRNGEAAQPQEEEEEEETGLKLGLGDFVFYSVLVGRASLYDWITTIISILAVLSGLVLTIFILVLKRKPLPALPISIFFGIIFFLVASLTLSPMMEDLVVSSEVAPQGTLSAGLIGEGFVYL